MTKRKMIGLALLPLSVLALLMGTVYAQGITVTSVKVDKAPVLDGQIDQL